MISSIIILIQTIAQVLSLLIIIDSLLSFFLSPFHPIREALGKILQPMYNPIRRILPTAGGFDFSPIVLIILVTLTELILVRLLSAIG
jgi:YggT family protein